MKSPLIDLWWLYSPATLPLSNNDESRTCHFLTIAALLVTLYACTLIHVVKYLVKLLWHHNPDKTMQKIFLIFLIFNGGLRITYFSAWLADTSHRNTCPSILQRKVHGSSFFSNLPGSLYVTGSSIIVFTFARLYHSVLMNSTHIHRRRLWVMGAVLVTLNLALYILTSVNFVHLATASPSIPLQEAYLYILTAAATLVACLFLAYGYLLYNSVERLLRSTLSFACEASHIHHSIASTAAKLGSPPHLGTKTQLSTSNPKSGQDSGRIVSAAVQTVAANHPDHDGIPDILGMGPTLLDVSLSHNPSSTSNPDTGLIMHPISDLEIDLHTTIMSQILSDDSVQSTSGTRSSSQSHPMSPNLGLLSPKQVREYRGVVASPFSPAFDSVRLPRQVIDAQTNIPTLKTNETSPLVLSVPTSPPLSNMKSPNALSRRASLATTPTIVYPLDYGSISEVHTTTDPLPERAETSENAEGNLSETSSRAAELTNPMAKILKLGIICGVCMVFRTILLVVMSEALSNEQPSLAALYYVLSEILPSNAMLLVLDTPTSQMELGKAAITTVHTHLYTSSDQEFTSLPRTSAP